VTLCAWLFLRFTRLGTAMRAVAANETAALLMGVGVDRIHAAAWMLSAAIAAVAGVLFAINFKLGYERAVKEFGVKDGIRLRFKKGTANFAAEMAQMKQAGVNVLANGGIFAGAANILSEARKLDMDIQSADVWSEGILASAKLAAPAGYDYLVGDYVALTGPAVEKFLAMAKQFTTPEELGSVSRYTFVTYVGLKSLAHAMQECGKELTRVCTIEKLRGTKNLDTGGLSAPVSFDNPQQLAGTEVAVYQLNAKELKFHELAEFKKY